MQWALVYICEAHASDTWPLKFTYERPTPKSLAQRARYARDCALELGFGKAGLSLHCDAMDNAFNTAFGAWPTAYYLMNQHGELLFVGEPDEGEYGYDVGRFVRVVREQARTTGAHEAKGRPQLTQAK